LPAYRVESRNEGFSLEVQEEALHRYAEQTHGKITKFYKIAETASKRAERKVFKELMAYCRTHAHKLDGLLFFKADRAARNLFDYVELERLEIDHGVKVIYISQPTENNPAGRMMRRTLANMAAFITEQQGLDVKEGLARRVASGLFISRASYGYSNIRRDGPKPCTDA
jgi:DNA invertase Pin-like site-specific DNA recombinase